MISVIIIAILIGFIIGILIYFLVPQKKKFDDGLPRSGNIVSEYTNYECTEPYQYHSDKQQPCCTPCKRPEAPPW